MLLHPPLTNTNTQAFTPWSHSRFCLLFSSSRVKQTNTVGLIELQFPGFPLILSCIWLKYPVQLNIHCSKHDVGHRRFGQNLLGLLVCNSHQSRFLEQRYHKYRSEYNTGSHLLGNRLPDLFVLSVCF